MDDNRGEVEDFSEPKPAEAIEEEKQTVRDIIEGLKRSPYWHMFRKRIIEFRIQQAKLEVMKPVGNTEGVYQSERAKGAFIALEALLELFDRKLPERKERSDDE